MQIGLLRYYTSQPYLVLKHPTQPLNQSISIYMLILFLYIRGHCGKHETTYIERIITSLLFSSVIYNTRTSKEVIRIRFCKNLVFSCVGIILRLRYQSIELALSSFSFSSKDRKLKADVLLADMIYNKK
jgi:hypothetical protein